MMPEWVGSLAPTYHGIKSDAPLLPLYLRKVINVKLLVSARTQHWNTSIIQKYSRQYHILENHSNFLDVLVQELYIFANTNQPASVFNEEKKLTALYSVRVKMKLCLHLIIISVWCLQHSLREEAEGCLFLAFFNQSFCVNMSKAVQALHFYQPRGVAVTFKEPIWTASKEGKVGTYHQFTWRQSCICVSRCQEVDHSFLRTTSILYPILNCWGVDTCRC